MKNILIYDNLLMDLSGIINIIMVIDLSTRKFLHYIRDFEYHARGKLFVEYTFSLFHFVMYVPEAECLQNEPPSITFFK